MQILSTNNGIAKTELTLDDVLTISNALNEVCNALDVAEFSTRMGVSVEDASALLRQFSDLYDQLNPS